MARIWRTPAACARASMSARSESNSGISTWACESISSSCAEDERPSSMMRCLMTRLASRGCRQPRSALLLEARADRHVFQKPGENGLAFGTDRRGNNHPVRFHTSQLARLQIHDDNHFAAYQLFRLISRRDSGDDLTHFLADVHHHFE